MFRRRQRPVGRSWRLDETYVKIKGKSAYLYRAVDKAGHTIDFLLTPTRDRDAAEAFLHKAIRTQGLPEKITIDKSGSNTAAITHYNQTHKTAIVIRHSKYLNNIVEIVFTQMTKADLLAAGMGRKHVADFHFPVGDEYSVNQ